MNNIPAIQPLLNCLVSSSVGAMTLNAYSAPRPSTLESHQQREKKFENRKTQAVTMKMAFRQAKALPNPRRNVAHIRTARGEV